MSVKSDANESEPVSRTNLPDMLRWTLEGVQEQIRFADSKAGFVLLVHTFLFGFIVAQAETLSTIPDDGRTCWYWIRILLLATYGLASIASMSFAIAAVIPKFGEKAPQCKIFFGHIVGCYGRNYESYHADVVKRSDSEWLSDLSSQIVENCQIAKDKHKRARNAAWLALVALIAAILGTATFFAGRADDAGRRVDASQATQLDRIVMPIPSTSVGGDAELILRPSPLT